MTDCEAQFEQSLGRFSVQHFPPERLLVALSGGLDSIVLLNLCHSLSPDRTQALHVNHGYSPLSLQWQSECQRLCDRLQVPLQVQQLPATGEPLQEAQARRRRYQIFHEQLAAGDLLLLAHHQDDQAETILLHLLQGRGAFGMPAMRRLGAGWLLRPLLETSRQTLQAYAERQNLRWIEDPSNLDTRHDRNFLRHQIMPQLAARFPHLPRRMTQAPSHLQALETLLVGSLQLETAELPLAVLHGQPASAQLAIVRSWLTAGGLSQPATAALAAFLPQLEQPADRQPELQLPGGTLRRYQGQLHFVPAVTVAYQPVPVNGAEELELPHGKLLVTQTKAAGAVPPAQLMVNFWQSTEEAVELPRTLLLRGHHHQIAELLRNALIPPWQRDGYPLICDAEGLLSLPGIARRDGAQGLLAGLEFRWEPAKHVRPLADPRL